VVTIEYDDIELEWTAPPSVLRVEIERAVRAEIRQHIKPIKAWQMQIGHFMATHGCVIYICGQGESEVYYCTIFI